MVCSFIIHICTSLYVTTLLHTDLSLFIWNVQKLMWDLQKINAKGPEPAKDPETGETTSCKLLKIQKQGRQLLRNMIDKF